jgi:prophage regulatory protein
MTYSLMRVADVANVTALSRSEIYRRVQAGTFPKQTRISHKVSAWKSTEVYAWIAKAMGDAPPISRKNVDLLEDLL